MLKKLSIKTNFILIGIIVGLFVGVSIRQALGDTTSVPGTARADNLTVNTSGQYTNGLIVANGNALVSGNVGIGTITPTVKLDVVGDIKTSSRVCIGTTCINENQLKALLGGNGQVTDVSVTDTLPVTTPAGFPAPIITYVNNSGTQTINASTYSSASSIPLGTSLTFSGNYAGFCAIYNTKNDRNTGYPIQQSHNPSVGFMKSDFPAGTYGYLCTASDATVADDGSLSLGPNGSISSFPFTITTGSQNASNSTFVATFNFSISGTTLTWTSSNTNSCEYNVSTASGVGGTNGWIPTGTLNGSLSLLGVGLSAGTYYTIRGHCLSSDGTYGPISAVTYTLPAATINLSISGTTFSWTSSNTNSCQYNVNDEAWMNVSPLNGSFSLTGMGLSVGTKYTISAHCLPSGSSTYGPTSTVTYTPTE